LKDYFIEQADYQRWACAELFKSLDTLSDEQRQASVGLFFKDIHRTVDHILIVVRNWRARLSGEFDQVKSYNELLYSDWEELKRALLDEFSQLKDWLAQKDPKWFTQAIEYPALDGTVRRVPVADGLIHVMTHSVHHRGQISAVCTRLHAPSPEMDFVFYRWKRDQ
jgi:uncharacterized damage-inducible protein DinB